MRLATLRRSTFTSRRAPISEFGEEHNAPPNRRSPMATEDTHERRHASSALVELSNAMVALHREHFGRGPGASRAFIVDGLAICVMSDVYTRVERTLIEAGRLDHVQQTRLLHHKTLEETYADVAETALGRVVVAAMSTFNSEPDLAVELFVLGAPLGENAAGS